MQNSYFFRWWCHFDDDNYVHVVQLIDLLQKYSSLESVYLGKPSTAKPLEIFDASIGFPVSNLLFKYDVRFGILVLHLFLGQKGKI